ncbi:ASCH domain-containing protein [Robiginitalea sp. SC105]|uniref:ASCH domain-containing protein n=1 Tax=Robiginitalea sp. SC105 TaxID=2762332 RepID=UPI00163A3ADD|nr:ASCH domain-containing protein [Robiginitalea sp. SC105]MBC2838399.1 ASCH domain-containing protein [Robiginitalea sp. SC105]
MKNTSAKRLWGDYLDRHLEYAFSGEPKVRPLGNNPEEADRNLKLICNGNKRSYSHSLLGIQHRGESLPQIGDFTILTDWEGNAKCILRTVAVRLKPFFSISSSYAKLEGEGDGSLEQWKEAHWESFARELAPFGRVPRESMIVVCEVFEKVYEG